MVEVVTREELKKGLADGSIALIDVREPNEFAAGHIPGAVLVPLSRFDPAQLPRDRASASSSPAGRASGPCRRSKWRGLADARTPAPITRVR